MERQAKDGTFYKQVGEDQWTPVTRTAKNGITYKKVGTDSWTPLESKAPKKENPRSAEAALEGFGEAATLGYLNNIQAAVEKPLFAALNAVTGNDVQADDYVTARDSYNKRQQNLANENPGAFAAGQAAGAIASSLPVARAAQGATMLARAGNAAKAGTAYGALQNTGETEGELGDLDLADRAQNAGVGALMGAGASVGTDALFKGVAKAGQTISNTKNIVGKRIGRAAEKLAENSTGATAAQSEKFRDGAGRELLDRKLIKFGDTAENIAERVGQAQNKAGKAIGDALDELDKQGVTASVDNLVKKLEATVADLDKTPGNEKLIKQIQAEIDNLYSRGQSNIQLSTAEQAKRNFQGRTKWNNPDMIDQQASAHLSDAFKQEVERSALNANKGLSDAFTEGKDTYALLSPIREAAERRAAQLNQSPMGGFLDVATTAAGGSVAGMPGAIAAGMTRRAVAPRISSSAAVTLDSISKRLLQQPQMARLAQTNPQAFRATVFSIANEAGAGGPATALPRAAENERPKKGPEKWVLDGIDKLNQAGIPAQDLEALRTSKQGRDLLIEASDATPGSKRMESVLRRIRTATAQGGQ